MTKIEESVKDISVIQYFSVVDVMAVLNCGRSKVYELIDSGEIKSVKMGGLRRIPQPALVEYQQRLAEQS